MSQGKTSRIAGIIDKVAAALITAGIIWLVRTGYISFKENPGAGIAVVAKAITILILLAGLVWLGYGTYDTIQGRSARAKTIGWTIILVLTALFIYQTAKIIVMPVGGTP